jgi:hypothetical protein
MHVREEYWRQLNHIGRHRGSESLLKAFEVRTQLMKNPSQISDDVIHVHE